MHQLNHKLFQGEALDVIWDSEYYQTSMTDGYPGLTVAQLVLLYSILAYTRQCLLRKFSNVQNDSQMETLLSPVVCLVLDAPSCKYVCLVSLCNNEFIYNYNFQLYLCVILDIQTVHLCQHLCLHT